jgi:hypothetical protein
MELPNWTLRSGVVLYLEVRYQLRIFKVNEEELLRGKTNGT